MFSILQHNTFADYRRHIIILAFTEGLKSDVVGNQHSSAKQVIETDVYFNNDLNIIGSFVLSIKHEEAEVQILLCSPSTGRNCCFQFISPVL